jgi:RNA polymerase sigma-70 factor (ECF subfamily)
VNTDQESTFESGLTTTDFQLSERGEFARLFRAYYSRLVRYADRLTGDNASAQDVVQDVFLKLWEKRADLTIESSLNALLYTMVRNRSLNAIRRAAREVYGSSLAEMPDRASDAASPDDHVDASSLRTTIRRWIEDLPPRRAEAFRLSRDHGLRHRDIADVMQVSERTVNTHILLALRELRQRLDQLENKQVEP